MSSVGEKDTTKSVEDQESVEDTAVAESNVDNEDNVEDNAKVENIGQCDVPTAFDEAWRCVGTVPPSTNLLHEGNGVHFTVYHREEFTHTGKEAVKDQDIVQGHVGQHVQAVQDQDIKQGQPVQHQNLVQGHVVPAARDDSTQNEVRARFAPKIASAGRKSYGILREGLMKSGETLLNEYTSPPLTYKKGVVFNSDQKHSYSYKSPDGDTISAYAVIAEDVQTDLITADVVDGGIGMKHIKVEVKNHQEGPWGYRVVIGGRKSSVL